MLFRCFVVLIFPLLALRACNVQVDFPIPAGDSFVPFSDVDSLDLYNTPLIQSQGGYEGVLLVGDDLGTAHGDLMYQNLMAFNIPPENIVFSSEISVFQIRSPGDSFNWGIYQFFLGRTGLASDGRPFDPPIPVSPSDVRIIGIPRFLPIQPSSFDGTFSLIGESNILFILPVSNVNPDEFDVFGRDLWYSDTPFWDEYPIASFDWFMRLFETGNVILASHVAHEEVDGEIVVKPNPKVVKCGEAKEYCFSLFDGLWPLGRYSSDSTSQLSAITFYLAQMYPTVEEIVSVLRSCAIDVGEPGPDEEYGVGVVNLVCPEVLSKELTVAARSLKVSEESHALTTLTNRLPESVSLFSSVGLDLHGMQGHAGVSYATQSLQAVALAGFGRSSLGIYSDLYHERSMFFELGMRKPLTPNLSFVGTYGHQYGNLSVDSVRAGLHAVKHIGRMQTSVYVGRHMFRCSLGLPGYQMAGARKVSFSRGVWEARFSLSLSL